MISKELKNSVLSIKDPRISTVPIRNFQYATKETQDSVKLLLTKAVGVQSFISRNSFKLIKFSTEVCKTLHNSEKDEKK